jgi:accessory gene regulator protein AgrB
MTKTQVFQISWFIMKYGFLIYVSCLLLNLGVIIPSILIWGFVFVDLGYEFLRMVEYYQPTNREKVK